MPGRLFKQSIPSMNRRETESVPEPEEDDPEEGRFFSAASQRFGSAPSGRLSKTFLNVPSFRK